MLYPKLIYELLFNLSSLRIEDKDRSYRVFWQGLNWEPIDASGLTHEKRKKPFEIAEVSASNDRNRFFYLSLMHINRETGFLFLQI